jgi:hypothetical protein
LNCVEEISPYCGVPKTLEKCLCTHLESKQGRALQNVKISIVLEKDDGLFCSDWRPATSSAESKGAVFSQLISGGNRSTEPFGLESFDPELTTEGLMAERPVEGNAEGAELPHG